MLSISPAAIILREGESEKVLEVTNITDDELVYYLFDRKVKPSRVDVKVVEEPNGKVVGAVLRPGDTSHIRVGTRHLSQFIDGEVYFTVT